MILKCFDLKTIAARKLGGNASVIVVCRVMVKQELPKKFKNQIGYI